MSGTGTGTGTSYTPPLTDEFYSLPQWSSTYDQQVEDSQSWPSYHQTQTQTQHQHTHQPQPQTYEDTSTRPVYGHDHGHGYSYSHSYSPYAHQQHTYTDVQAPNQWYRPYPSDGIDQPIKKKRASRPKVRTGCTTCKIRRVKCDETKPSCLRCSSTGRKCDGYEFSNAAASNGSGGAEVASRDSTPRGSLPPRHPGTRVELAVKKVQRVPNLFVRASPGEVVQFRPQSPSQPQSQAQLNQGFIGTVQERRAFHRFKYRTVPAFAGGSETEFWTGLVLRAATSEPVIRDAVIALGSLHEDYETRGGAYDQSIVSSSSFKDTAFLYGRAIRKLYQRIDTITGETANLAIIASILFACFEVLRRNNMAAVVHYQNGMRQLMKQMGEKERSRLENASVEDLAAEKRKDTVVKVCPQDDLDRMLRVFARYDVQACTFSKPKAEALIIDLPRVPPNEVGLMEVRRYLDNLLIAVYQLVKSDLSLFRYWKAAEVSPTWLEKRDEALVTFQEWLDVLEKSIPSDSITLRNHGITASKSILGLILQIKVALIMLRTCIDCGPEATFDQFDRDFEEMISRVENMTQILGLNDGVPLDRETVPFSMELGVIHPLFFIAWKCRDWKLRRRAIAELRKCGKEGVWEGPIMAVVAERIAKVEEEGLVLGAFVPEASRIHDLRKGVEYDDRVVRAEIRLAQDSTWKNWTVLREAIPF